MDLFRIWGNNFLILFIDKTDHNINSTENLSDLDVSAIHVALAI